MADTKMPRGMLLGCQRRIGNLESKPIWWTLSMATLLATTTAVGFSFVLLTECFRRKSWWEEIYRVSLREKKVTKRRIRGRNGTMTICGLEKFNAVGRTIVLALLAGAVTLVLGLIILAAILVK